MSFGQGQHFDRLPSLTIHLDATETAFDVIEAAGIASIADGVADGRVVLVDTVEVGGMPEGTARGNASVLLAFALPDGRVALAETTLALFSSAARALVAKYGEPR